MNFNKIDVWEGYKPFYKHVIGVSMAIKYRHYFNVFEFRILSFYKMSCIYDFDD